MLHDLRTAVRQLLKFPGYSLVVILTLGFGLAVNTQIFSMVDGIFLRSMPVRDSNRLTVIVERSDTFNLPHQLSFQDFQDIRAGSKMLTSHVAYFTSPANFAMPGQMPQRIWIQAVTPDGFARLGIQPFLGRLLQSSDGELPPGNPVAVLSYDNWQVHFGGDPGVIGRSVLINGKSFTIVGVSSPRFGGFSGSLTIGVFVPSGSAAQLRPDGDGLFKYRSAAAWSVLAYLQPHATISEANNELAVFASRFAKDFPEDHRNVRLQAALEQHARPDPSMTDFAPVFTALFVGMVVLVLFIACANVANLMTARAVDRQKELVMRTALGATRWRIIRQLLIESLLLATIAGFIGFLLATFGNEFLRNLAPVQDIPIRRSEGMGWQSWCFTAGMSLVAGFAAGLFPALRASRVDLNEQLKQGTTQSGGRTRHRFRNMLVVGQVAMSCIVLVATALFLRGLGAAATLNLGFQPGRLLLMSLDLDLQGYDHARGLQFEKKLLDRVRTLPGIESASIALHIPFSYFITMREHWPENSPAHLTDGHSSVAFSAVDPEFLATMRIPILQGRNLRETDDEHAPEVAVINEEMARKFWPGMNPIGQHFHRDWSGSPPIEVVGVVATGKYVMLTEEPRPYYYTPQRQVYMMPITVVARTATDPHVMSHTIREVIRDLDPNLPVYDITSMDDHMRSSAFALMPLRAGAGLAAVQGVIGLLLAIMGLFAVVSYGVRSRTREIGVRIALGADHTDVIRFVTRDGLRLTVIGLITGMLFSLVLCLALSHVMFGIQPIDPIAIPAVLGVLIATSALACYWPARHAVKIDPIVALRTE